jgi:hypothetical protein
MYLIWLWLLLCSGFAFTNFLVSLSTGIDLDLAFLRDSQYNKIRPVLRPRRGERPPSFLIFA